DSCSFKCNLFAFVVCKPVSESIKLGFCCPKILSNRRHFVASYCGNDQIFMDICIANSFSSFFHICLCLIWADDHSLIWDNLPYAFYDAVPYSREIGWFQSRDQASHKLVSLHCPYQTLYGRIKISGFPSVTCEPLPGLMGVSIGP